MLVERRNKLQTSTFPGDRRVNPITCGQHQKTVPACRVENGPYGLYFAYRKNDSRPAPGTNYLYAWLHWCLKYN